MTDPNLTLSEFQSRHGSRAAAHERSGLESLGSGIARGISTATARSDRARETAAVRQDRQAALDQRASYQQEALAQSAMAQQARIFEGQQEEERQRVVAAFRMAQEARQQQNEAREFARADKLMTMKERQLALQAQEMEYKERYHESQARLNDARADSMSPGATIRKDLARMVGRPFFAGKDRSEAMIWEPSPDGNGRIVRTKDPELLKAAGRFAQYGASPPRERQKASQPKAAGQATGIGNDAVKSIQSAFQDPATVQKILTPDVISAFVQALDKMIYQNGK